MKLFKLQDNNKKRKKFRLEGLPEGSKDIKKVFHYQGLLYVSKVICSELISRQYDNSLIGYFGIEKTQELIAKKYYWPILQKDVEVYVKGYNMCLIQR